MSVPVPLGALGATLCPPVQPTDTIVVLLSGAATNAGYWEFPYKPETYSFRRAMNAAGYATLLLDRLGSGTSTHPPSIAVTSTAQARDIYKIVSRLRNGSHGHGPFATIVLGGVSLGAGISVLEATTYHDVDAVLLTGFSHAVDPVGTLKAAATFVPAGSDPRFAGRGLEPGYLTTAPGSRAANFLGPDTDPGVVAADEAHVVDMFTPAEMDAIASTIAPMTTHIDVPVLLVNGERDALCLRSVCASSTSLFDSEAAHFSPAARLQTYVLPDARHATTTAPNTTTEFQAHTVAWIKTPSIRRQADELRVPIGMRPTSARAVWRRRDQHTRPGSQ
ncbi:alpha/beta hydrolase [Nocardia sp. NPDC050408]|uniref:alpha/beta hydrolase n=1 Tax=Nocardia sp. NPDC050408 TaxID=3364319 RepID=UPI00378C3877